MTPKSLVVSKFGDPKIPSSLASELKNGSWKWLCLWPLSNQFKSNYPNVNFVDGADFLPFEDDYSIADYVTDISTKWFEVYAPEEQELNIEGLKISQIFSYELEQTLTQIVFQVLAIKRTIEKFDIGKIILIDREEPLKENYGNFHNGYKAYSLAPIIKMNYPNLDLSSVKIANNEFLEKIEFWKNRAQRIFSKGFSYLKAKISQRLQAEVWNEGEVIISNSDRCLQLFAEEANEKFGVHFLRNTGYKKLPFDSSELDIKVNTEFENLRFDGYFERAVPIMLAKFQELNQFYASLKEQIKKYPPRIYVSVNVANSNEVVKAWAFKKSGIRTVWAAEGMGQPNHDIEKVYKSTLRPELDLERWVISEFHSKYYLRHKNTIQISGYLESHFSKVSRPKKVNDKRGSKFKVLFALSSASEVSRRAIMSEDMALLLKSVRDISELINSIEGAELILKMHPGDAQNLKLFDEQISNEHASRIVVNGNLQTMIAESDLVIIHDTSAGTESLIMGKDVICYNYSGLPSYMTGLKSYINDDPKKGPALMFAQTLEEVKDLVNEVKRIDNKIVDLRDDFDKVLYNASANFNPTKIIENLLILE